VIKWTFSGAGGGGWGCLHLIKSDVLLCV
jgi:hypothetical protein